MASAPPPAPARIRHRRDFLAANRGARIVTPAFILLVAPNDVGHARFGFTVSRKVGNAVVRNRVRRRLREMVRIGVKDRAVPAADHVFIARPMASEPPFAQLLADAAGAVAKAAARLARPA